MTDITFLENATLVSYGLMLFCIETLQEILFYDTDFFSNLRAIQVEMVSLMIKYSPNYLLTSLAKADTAHIFYFYLYCSHIL